MWLIVQVNDYAGNKHILTGDGTFEPLNHWCQAVPYCMFKSPSTHNSLGGEYYCLLENMLFCYIESCTFDYREWRLCHQRCELGEFSVSILHTNGISPPVKAMWRTNVSMTYPGKEKSNLYVHTESLGDWDVKFDVCRYERIDWEPFLCSEYMEEIVSRVQNKSWKSVMDV